MTVRRYVAESGYVTYRRPEGRPRALAGLEEWLAGRFRRHGGNADVVRQELLAEKGIALSLRTIEREVAPLRRELASEALATIRFETPPGHQLQIDFGERRIAIGGLATKVFLFVATLGFSRRMHVRAFRNERQESWLEGLESTFRHFGGVTSEVLFDNDRGLVSRHEVATREVTFDAIPGLRSALGLPAAGLRSLPGAHQGQGRARGGVCEEECRRRTRVRELRGTRGASGRLGARGRGRSDPWHDR